MGRGRGTVSVYPESTVAQLDALLTIHDTEKKVAHIAWRMWWMGYPISEDAIRALLRQVASKFDAVRRRLRDPSGDGLSDEAIRLIESPPSKTLFGRPLPAIERERLQSAVLETAVEILAGTFAELPIDPETGDSAPVVATLINALGLERGSQDSLGAHRPWLPDDTSQISQDLQPIFAALASVPWPMLADSLTIEELVQARDTMRSMSTVLPAFAAYAELAFGKNAFGFSHASRMLSKMLRQVPVQVLVVVAIAHLGRVIEEVRDGSQAYCELGAQWRAEMQPALALLDALRDEVPEVTHVLNPQKLLRAMQDPEKYGSWTGRVRARVSRGGMAGMAGQVTRNPGGQGRTG
jgi:hypothetical protein